MSYWYKKILRPLFFLLPAEKAHHMAMFLLKAAFKIPGKKKFVQSYFSIKNKKTERNVAGLNFPNPVGLAAGFDKDAKYIDELSALGFGFIEVGTITPEPQSGNPQPRLFRLAKDKALINRMGFNNDGAEAVVKRLKKRKSNTIIGGNIGKNKGTPNEDAIKDYEICFNKLFDYVDYFVVNVSSPNTPGLRALQDKEPLKNILSHLQAINKKKKTPKPVFLKIAPDLTAAQLNDIVEIVQQTQIAGVIATNTTISREGLKEADKAKEAGGLSGKPLKKRSTEVIRYLREKLGKDVAIIGVGGIFSAEDAMEKITAGADLVQVYTGFIYQGPGLVKEINQKIS